MKRKENSSNSSSHGTGSSKSKRKQSHRLINISLSISLGVHPCRTSIYIHTLTLTLTLIRWLAHSLVSSQHHAIYMESFDYMHFQYIAHMYINMCINVFGVFYTYARIHTHRVHTFGILQSCAIQYIHITYVSRCACKGKFTSKCNL